MPYKFFALAFVLLLCLTSKLPAQTAGKPQFGSWGVDLSGGDRSLKPGDDFFRFVNGKWLDVTQIPPDKPGYSLRLAMSDVIEQRLHEMMETLAKTEPDPAALPGKVGLYYRSFMDEAAIDKLGAEPIAPQLNDIKQAKTRDDLARLMGRTVIDLEGSVFNFTIDVDLKDPHHYAFYLRQGGSGFAGSRLLSET